MVYQKIFRRVLVLFSFNVLKSIGTIFCFVLCVHSGVAQNWFFNQADSASQHTFTKEAFLQVRYQHGGFFPGGDSGVQYIQKNAFDAIDVRYGFVGYGRKKWHQLHHYPTFGLGFTKFFFHPKDNLFGNPVATYLFFNEPIAQFKKSKLAYDFDVGLSYGWKPYDSLTNPEQKSIGSSVNFIFMLGIQYEFKLSNRLEGIIGGNLNHISNGRIRSPNRGVNQYAVNASLRYRLSPLKSKRKNNHSDFSVPVNIYHSIDTFRSMFEYYVV